MKKCLISFAVAAIVIFIGYDDAVFACRCVFPPEKLSKSYSKAYYESAVVVFTGEVVESDFETVKFKVEKVWKGAVGDEFVMSTGGRYVREGVVELPSSCHYNFENKQKYLVFGRLINGETKLEQTQTFKCGGTRELQRVSDEELGNLDEIISHEKRNQESEHIEPSDGTPYFISPVNLIQKLYPTNFL